MLSPDYVKQMPILSGGGWDVWLFLEKNPIIPLRQEEADLYCQYHDLLYSRLTALHRGRYHKELIDALLSAFLFEFHDVLERFISVNLKRLHRPRNSLKPSLKPWHLPIPRAAAWLIMLLASTYLPSTCRRYARKSAITPPPI